jgi:hypothetical protein
MTDKLLLFRTLIIAVMVCLLAWDAILALNGQELIVPPQNLLLACLLLWILSLFFPQNSDDDWAGQL